MRPLICIMLLLFSHSSFSQIDLDYLLNTVNVESGRCYSSVMVTPAQIPTEDDKYSYIEIVPAQFEDYIDSMPIKEMLAMTPWTEDNNYLQIEKTPSYSEWHEESDIAETIIGEEYLIRNLCYREYEAAVTRYDRRTLQKVLKMFEDKGFPELAIMPVKKKRLISNGTLKMVENVTPDTKFQHRTIAFRKGTWSLWKEFQAYPGCTENPIWRLQIALNQKGYKAPLDGVLEHHTENALHSFQRDNDLPEGNISAETLKLLGLKYWRE